MNHQLGLLQSWLVVTLSSDARQADLFLQLQKALNEGITI